MDSAEECGPGTVARFSDAAAKKEEKNLRFSSGRIPMPHGGAWLSLKVSEKVILQGKRLRPGLFVSVPKGIVRLATRRNRLRRLIREAIRKDAYFGDERKIYYFRIHRWPGELGLSDVKLSIEKLK